MFYHPAFKSFYLELPMLELLKRYTMLKTFLKKETDWVKDMPASGLYVCQAVASGNGSARTIWRLQKNPTEQGVARRTTWSDVLQQWEAQTKARHPSTHKCTHPTLSAHRSRTRNIRHTPNT